MMHDGTDWGSWGFGFGHWIFWILSWGLIIFGVVALVRGISGNSGGSSPKSALDILEERYARGEIDREEFERMRRELKN